jgi:hypothetical protein
MLTHNATHNETSDHNRVNEGLLYLIAPLIYGIQARPPIVGPRVSDHGLLVLGQ